MLEANAGGYRWVAATIDANSAAGYELATGEPVMAVGGFNGSDPAPTLAQFQGYVASGQIHYFIGGGMHRGTSSSAIESWVSQHFTATTVNGVTVYDLTQPAS
jgi:4-amino-4-deoxy-L-arabinose transferase-like glycosyltransferase